MNMTAYPPIFAIAWYTFFEAIRNRLLWLVLAFMVAAFTFAEFLGEVAVTESLQFQSGFLGAVLRVVAVFIVSLFIITSMVREFSDKGLELVLSLPIPRSSYFLGKLFGFAWLAGLVALACCACLMVYAPVFQVVLWGISLAMELLIVAALSIVCVFTFTHVTSALSVVMAFYVVARSIAAIQLMATGPLVASTELSQQLIEKFIDGLAFLLPELHRFTPSSWLIHYDGEWAQLAPLAGQSAIYVVLLSAVALFDLYRKNL